MAYTQQQLDDLEASIAEGALTVKYEDRVVTYRSLKEMVSIRDVIRSALGLTGNKPRRILSSPSKFGFNNSGNN
jgi:hypothetical protein